MHVIPAVPAGGSSGGRILIFTIMKLRKLKYYLKGMYSEGIENMIVYFSDQDSDYYTITDIYMDEDGDVCLEAGEGYDHSQSDIFNELRGLPGDAYVYVYDPDNDIFFDIEGGWYYDDDSDPVMDIVYTYDDDDDDDW